MKLPWISRSKHEATPTNGTGWVYFNEDAGVEYAPNHPVESGEVPDATDIRRSTAMEDVLNDAVQMHFRSTLELKAELSALKATRDHLDSELEESRNQPWPEWAKAVLKVIRNRSGYDGYDDALDGVDLPGELEDTMAELEQQAEKNYQEARVDRDVEQHKHAAEHYRKQADELRPDALKYRDRLRRDREHAKQRRAVKGEG